MSRHLIAVCAKLNSRPMNFKKPSFAHNHRSAATEIATRNCRDRSSSRPWKGRRLARRTVYGKRLRGLGEILPAICPPRWRHLLRCRATQRMLSELEISTQPVRQLSEWRRLSATGAVSNFRAVQRPLFNGMNGEEIPPPKNEMHSPRRVPFTTGIPGRRSTVGFQRVLSVPLKLTQTSSTGAGSISH